MQRLVEIRSYQLKRGIAAEFHAAVETTAVPMLREWGADVVAYGPSEHAPDTYYLIRAYVDLDDLNRTAPAQAALRAPPGVDGPSHRCSSRLAWDTGCSQTPS